MTAGVRIVGCGNADRGDDAAGLLVARRLRGLAVEAAEECCDPLSLIESWRGANDVLIIDAMVSGARPGSITCWDVGTDCRGVPPWTPEPSLHNAGAPTEGRPYRLEQCQTSTHGFGIAQAIELARTLNELPRTLRIYGIEGSRFEVGVPPSPEVLAAVEHLAQQLAFTRSRVRS